MSSEPLQEPEILRARLGRVGEVLEEKLRSLEVSEAEIAAVREKAEQDD